ncbi:MAG: hypothetical protein ABWZ76_11960 [Acidimicrobiales bacterium]
MVNSPAETRSPTSSTTEGTVRLCANVDRPLAALHDLFASPAVEGLLESSLRNGIEADVSAVRVRVSEPVWISDCNVRMTVAWTATPVRGRERVGEAGLSLLVVQSGHEAITELLVTMPLEDAHAAHTDLTRLTLDDLVRRLEDVCQTTVG